MNSHPSTFNELVPEPKDPSPWTQIIPAGLDGDAAIAWLREYMVAALRERATALAAGHPTPRLRATEAVVDATTQELWQVLLPLTLLDRVRVTRDYGANTIATDLHIQGMTLDIEVTGGDPVEAVWVWTFQTSGPSLTAPILLNIGPGLGTGELGF